MKLLNISFYFILLSQFELITNKRILSILPMHTISHYPMFDAIFEALIKNGHEIDLFTPLEVRKIPGLNVIHTEFPDVYAVFKTNSLAKIRKMTVHDMLQRIFGKNINVCEEWYKQDAFRKIRDTKTKYDLFIVEMLIMDCLYGYAHILKTPVVAVTTSVDFPWGTNRLGNPDNPAYIVNYLRASVPEMTLYERVLNTLTLVQAKFYHQWYKKQQELEAKKMFGEDLPPLDDLVANTSLFIVNSHYSLNQARPNVPNVIEAGGLHIKEPKQLSEYLSNFLGNSKFIYFSLGSLAKIQFIPIETLQNFCNAFKDLKYKVLWKTDKSKLPTNLQVPDNMYADSWMPQLDILCHPNIVLFITHNGLMSTQEAVYCGVPMLSIPLFADQFLNAKSVTYKGLSKEINIEKISRKEIYTAISELIEDQRYKQNAQELSRQFKDRPRKPLEEAIYWIEYVFRHNGAPQLRSRAAHLAWYQSYLLDVGLLIGSCLVFILSVVYFGIRNILRKITQNSKHKQF